ncbi:hypothetical protein C4A76_10705 [Brevibacillus laterosporus]|uniref:hypothetical protein n=1 Tax=Brevibacillus laterosporus TaxID=1465 RepID=UPI000CE4F1EC|nr:hypothetical protein [Brevibacillus laterosporus]PPA87937.1 hypothetical protein C4A76_10705 [Brevibacillus laterosporus]
MKNNLDDIALNAKKGCQKSKRLIYKEFIPIINCYVRENWFKVENEATLTKRLLDRLECAIEDYRVEKGAFRGFAKKNLERTFRDYIKSRRFKRTNTIPIHKKIDDDKNTIIDVLPDVSANTESDLIEKESVIEKIALLAKGDPRKKAILLAWSDGFYNDLALSELLAQLFGGKPNSHRQTIKRFRTFCQAALSQTA